MMRSFSRMEEYCGGSICETNSAASGRQTDSRVMTIVARSGLETKTVLRNLAETIHRLDPAIPLYDTRSLVEHAGMIAVEQEAAFGKAPFAAAPLQPVEVTAEEQLPRGSPLLTAHGMGDAAAVGHGGRPVHAKHDIGGRMEAPLRTRGIGQQKSRRFGPISTEETKIDHCVGPEQTAKPIPVLPVYGASIGVEYPHAFPLGSNALQRRLGLLIHTVALPLATCKQQ